MTTVKVLLEVSIDNANDWLGLEDYKKYHGAADALEALNIMAKLEESTPLNQLVNLCDQSTPSKFVTVTTGEHSPETKIDEALEWLSMIPLHVKSESHHGGHIMHFLENGIACLKKLQGEQNETK